MCEGDPLLLQLPPHTLGLKVTGILGSQGLSRHILARWELAAVFHGALTDSIALHQRLQNGDRF